MYLEEELIDGRWLPLGIGDDDLAGQIRDAMSVQGHSGNPVRVKDPHTNIVHWYCKGRVDSSVVDELRSLKLDRVREDGRRAGWIGLARQLIGSFYSDPDDDFFSSMNFVVSLKGLLDDVIRGVR